MPGRAKLTVDLRNADNDVLAEAQRRLDEYLRELAVQESVKVSTRRLVRFDLGLVEKIEHHARAKGYACRRMTSGAGHDAQMMELANE